MADIRSNKSKYPSRYSPGKWVTGSQYIVELVCEQSAKHQGKDLPLQFWKQDEWAKFFRSQTRKINQLVKKYDETAIINTVKSCRIRTLLPKWVEQQVQKEDKILSGKREKKRQEEANQPKHQERIIDVPKTRKARPISTLDKFLAFDEEVTNGEESSEER